MKPSMLLVVTAIPLLAGVIVYLIPRRMAGLIKLLAFVGTAAACGCAVALYSAQPLQYLGDSMTGPLFEMDDLSAFIMLGVAFFSGCMILYSLGFVDDEKISPRTYYANFLWCVGASYGIALSGSLITLLIFWGFLGLPFYLLINLGSEGADIAAKKTLIVLGGTDSLLILGVAAIWVIRDNFALAGAPIEVAGNPVALLACLCLAAAAFAKAGGMPFHSWVPDASATAPAPVVALLPAALDKLLGIYLFALICLDLFVLSGAVRTLFLMLGAITVLGAVMAALVQHNLRRLLGFHAVSQVGYMIMGISTGTPVGVMGGLFHMLNHAIYKSALFLCAGAAERRSGETDLARMGGLAKSMPITFAVAVISALAISGVPPFNGFVSKWMVYQGIISLADGGGYMWIVLVVAAMFGSALTLASFVKVLYSVFLGQPPSDRPAEPGPRPNGLMLIPLCILGALCVLFGVFAYTLPIAKLVGPAVPAVADALSMGGQWVPGLATLLVAVALLAGIVIYLAGASGTAREAKPFVGGEIDEARDAMRFAGTDFYRTIQEMGFLRGLYIRAEQKWCDLYDLGRRAAFYVSGGLQALHSGVLLTYVTWCVLGLIALLWFFMAKG